MTDKAITKYDQFKITLRSDAVRERFDAILSERAEVFMSSLLSVVAGNQALQSCDTASILTCAAKAAVLNLPIEPALGFASIVPFKNDAVFILGYKGYVQLAIRTSAYDVINATEIYEGEQIIENRLTGEITLNGKRTSDEVIGFASYFRLTNGFEKYVYMTIDEVHAHGKRYSKSYGNQRSAWTTNFDDMGKKTVIRQLLSKWGLLSIDMQDADMSLVPSSDNGRLTEAEDMVVPDFGDIIEGDLVQEDEQPEPEQEVEVTTDSITVANLDDATAVTEPPPSQRPARTAPSNPPWLPAAGPSPSLTPLPTEPQPELLPPSNGDVFDAVVEAKLAVNAHGARAALQNYCRTGYDTEEKAITWMRMYRGWKDLDLTTPEAAEKANKGESPK